jgi:hypothetical protein
MVSHCNKTVDDHTGKEGQWHPNFNLIHSSLNAVYSPKHKLTASDRALYNPLDGKRAHDGSFDSLGRLVRMNQPSEVLIDAFDPHPRTS